MDPSRSKNPKAPTAPAATQPRLVDLSEVGENLLVRIELPGVKSADVDVSVRDGSLIIRQEKTPSHSPNLPKLRDMREDVFFRAEYLYLHNLINLTGHNIRKACELSGLSRSRLYTLLKKYQITSHYQIASH
ncbi:MAG: hypothetical protein NDI73_04645 [Desulfuromonadales bacterium]|nr:hypothetical protein [Desulfuromonadales bacterium]